MTPEQMVDPRPSGLHPALSNLGDGRYSWPGVETWLRLQGCAIHSVEFELATKGPELKLAVFVRDGAVKCGYYLRRPTMREVLGWLWRQLWRRRDEKRED
jgi:hypothetical protein